MVQGESLMVDFYKKIFKDREKRLKLVSLLSFIPDEPYIKFVYRIKTGKRLNLKNPRGFTEKQNWLKIHDIHPEYAQLVDKLKVREIVKEKIGEKYLIELLGSWDRFEDINFDLLPQKFVLKCNHDSGSVKLINDKNKIDKAELSKFFSGRLSLNPYCFGREYPYKTVKPKILAERFMENDSGEPIRDYKFLCFNGEPKYVFVCSERGSESGTKFDFFDMDFNHLDIRSADGENSKKLIEKPISFEEMKQCVRVLAKKIRFVRMDFYEINGKCYFGEYTFFDSGGYDVYRPIEVEYKLGDMIDISDIND